MQSADTTLAALRKCSVGMHQAPDSSCKLRRPPARVRTTASFLLATRSKGAIEAASEYEDSGEGRRKAIRRRGRIDIYLNLVRRQEGEEEK